MNEREVLQNLKTILDHEQFDAIWLTTNEKTPCDTLLLYMGHDAKKRERMLEITARRQEMGQGLNSKLHNKECFHLTFSLKLPFVCQDEMLFDLGSTILYLNRLLDLPGFEMNEAEAQPSFRYVLLTEAPLEKQILLAITGMISLYISGYSELLEKVSSGEKTFNQILESVYNSNSSFFD